MKKVFVHVEQNRFYWEDILGGVNLLFCSTSVTFCWKTPEKPYVIRVLADFMHTFGRRAEIDRIRLWVFIYYCSSIDVCKLVEVSHKILWFWGISSGS